MQHLNMVVEICMCKKHERYVLHTYFIKPIKSTENFVFTSLNEKFLIKIDSYANIMYEIITEFYNSN